jgi:2-polyprenyl-3-methyl-5-hydroxy-6-metoxy-1,4-benzoquinol methylase
MLMNRCPICDSNDTCQWSNWRWHLPVNEREFGYRNCSECGTIFSDPLPTAQEMKLYYRDFYNYSWFETHLPFKKIQAAHRWHRLRSLSRNYLITRGNVLDVGCGHGLFLASAKRGKWTTTGVDYPSRATRYAREKLGLKIVEGDLRTLISEGKFKTYQFDFVTAWHCLEHDVEPLSYLQSFNQVLAPKGKMLIAVPNAEALGMRLVKEAWVWCQEPYVHVFHFTEKSLNLLARKAGLRVLSTWTRNTWDAHPFFDVYAVSRVRQLANQLRRFSVRAAFWFEEGSRLACYTASCHKHWLCGQERNDNRGSELLMLAERADVL